MRCFTCANCSWNSLTSSNNPSSLILDVLSGQSLTCRFRILQYWFSGSPSLAHRFVNFAFSLTQYSTIKPSVSATMAYSSLYVSMISFLNLLVLSGCLTRCLVSLVMLNILSVAKCLDSLLHVIRFTFVFRDIVLVHFFCLFKFLMLAFVGIVA